MSEAPAVTRVIAERGQHFAEVTVLLRGGGQEARLRGPGRRGRPEALKDCLELRKVAVKNTDDPALLNLRQLKKKLEETTWTVKDLGGRQLDGAEGPPPGYTMPRSLSHVQHGGTGVAANAAQSAGLHRLSQSAGDDPAAKSTKFKGLVRGNSASMDAVIEVADVAIALCEARKLDWRSRAKVTLQKAFKRFGTVVEVRISDGDDGDVAASVRFASAKATEQVMCGAPQGYLALGDGGEVRLRHPSSKEAVWRRFPPPRSRPEPEAQPSKKKLRPNERFAPRLPGDLEPEPDESERFWEAQRDVRGKAAEPPPSAVPPPPPPEEPELRPPPAKPAPAELLPGASEEDREACKGQESVAKEMADILEMPFSRQKKAVKALRLRWHPDKNPDNAEVATRVFQFIQEHDEWLAHNGMS